MSGNGSHPNIDESSEPINSEEREATDTERFHEILGALHEIRDDVKETKKDVREVRDEIRVVKIEHGLRLTTLEKLVTASALIGGSAPWIVEFVKWLFR